MTTEDKPTNKSAAKPAAKSAAKPAAKSAAKPAAKSAAKPAAKPKLQYITVQGRPGNIQALVQKQVDDGFAPLGGPV
jgi:hypothetical protein